MPLSPAVKVALGVLGGWLAITAPGVVTIALRLREFDPSGLPSTYALTLALGWLTLIVALIASGAIGDAVHRRTSSRALLARIGVPLMAVGGVLLAVAPSPGALAVAWVLVQVPSAMVITTALAEGGEVVSPSRRGLTSGLVGAAPIVALLLGSIGVRILSDSLSWAFVIPAFAGALVAAPLMGADTHRTTSGAIDETAHWATTGTGNRAPAIWLAFLSGSFLLSWATATTNGFIVTYVQNVVDVVSTDVANFSSLAVIIASALAVASSIGAGTLAARSGRTMGLWIAAASLCSLALLVLVLVPTPAAVVVIGALFGIAFGAANGLELSVVILVRSHHDRLGRDFGILTAVTTVPFVLVPALATVVLRTDAGSGVRLLFALACAFSALAALVVAVAALRARGETSARGSFT